MCNKFEFKRILVNLGRNKLDAKAGDFPAKLDLACSKKDSHRAN